MRNSLHSCAASVLLCAMTSAGFCTRSIDAGHRHRLAGAGGAQQRHVALAGVDALGDAVDRLGLVGGGGEDGIQPKLGHEPQDVSDPDRTDRPRLRRSAVCPIRRPGMRAPMATATRPGPFARKSHDVLVRDATADPEHGLKRSVGVLDLTALGIGAVIGTGIFVIIGEAIGDAGPSIIFSFALAGRDVPVLGLLLRRAGLVDPGLGQRVHLRLRDAGRAGRVDHRLGPDPRVRRVGGGGRRRLGRLPEVAAGLAVRHHAPGRRSPGRPARAAPPTCPPSSSCSP